MMYIVFFKTHYQITSKVSLYVDSVKNDKEKNTSLEKMHAYINNIYLHKLEQSLTYIYIYLVDHFKF